MKDSYFERQKVKDMLDKKKVKLGIAPIGWTNDDMPDLGKENTFQQCVSEMALAGFTGSEVGGKYPTDVETLKKALDLRGIQICNCWFSSFLISRPYEETEKEFIKQTDFLKAMGAKVIGVSEQSYSIQGKDQPIFEGKYVMNDEEWKLLTDGLNKLGQIAKDKGMMLTFHHHMGTVPPGLFEPRVFQITDAQKEKLFAVLKAVDFSRWKTDAHIIENMRVGACGFFIDNSIRLLFENGRCFVCYSCDSEDFYRITVVLEEICQWGSNAAGENTVCT